MATGVKSWSSTAGDNDNADSNINWLENQAPSTVNNSARAMMAAIRDWYVDAEWRDWGHTVTYVSATTFTIAADVTSIYVPGRSIRCTDSTTLYGFVVSSSFGSPNTTVTVVLESGSLSGSLTAVALGPDTTTPSVSHQAVRWFKGGDIASANDLPLPVGSNYNDVTGTTTINGLTDGLQNETRKLQFDGALTLKHNTAPSAGYSKLWLTTSGDITTATGDEFEFTYDGTYWRLTAYKTADGSAITASTTAGVGASIVLISSATAANDASIAFTGIDSTYDEYIIIFTGVVPVTNAAILGLQYGYGGTPTWITTGGYSVGASSYDYLPITGDIGNGAGGSADGRVYVRNLDDTSYYRMSSWKSVYNDSTSNYVLQVSDGGRAVDTTNAITALRLLMSTGNISVGDFYLYGVKKS